MISESIMFLVSDYRFRPQIHAWRKDKSSRDEFLESKIIRVIETISQSKDCHPYRLLKRQPKIVIFEVHWVLSYLS